MQQINKYHKLPSTHWYQNRPSAQTDEGFKKKKKKSREKATEQTDLCLFYFIVCLQIKKLIVFL